MTLPDRLPSAAMLASGKKSPVLLLDQHYDEQAQEQKNRLLKKFDTIGKRWHSSSRDILESTA